mmetsp:Transcript_42133/g.98276  ORF Transcript_42133/g.98276 Transcript_42133/m.98276 type:complete len:92 (+) Transcript_42133:124-399(+)
MGCSFCYPSIASLEEEIRRHRANESLNLGCNQQIAMTNAVVKQIVAHPKFKDLPQETQDRYLASAGAAPNQEMKQQARIALEMRNPGLPQM